MLEVRFHPLSTWPGKKTLIRKKAPFGTTFNRDLRFLERELNHLKASEIRVFLDIDPSDIRIDGWPRSSVTPRFPGVILSYRSLNIEYTMPCDGYTEWRSNLHAIALTLERLRAIERYGVSRGQQYAGFRALPAPEKPVGAAKALGQMLNTDISNLDQRQLKSICHPDKWGGNRVRWDLMEQAFKELGWAANA